jgi:hypothetical protein
MLLSENDKKERIKAFKITALHTLTTLFLVIAFYNLSETNSTYLNIGPTDDLYIGSMRINTWENWIKLVAIILIVNITKVIVQDYGMPAMLFYTFDPSQTYIREFSRRELEGFVIYNGFLSSIVDVFTFILIISQIDIAIISSLVPQVVSSFLIHFILKPKAFRLDGDPEPIAPQTNEENKNVYE